MRIEDEKRRADKIGEISDFTSGSKRGATIKLARNVCRVCHAERVGPIYNGNCATRNGKCQMHITRESGCQVREGRGRACRRASHRRGGKGAIHFITYFIFMPEHSATNFLVGKLPSFDMGQRRRRRRLRRLRRFLASHGHPRDRPTVVCYSAPLAPKTASEEARREREDHHDVLCNRRRIAKIWSAAPPTGAAAGERESRE